jgi:hypothetical protein
MVSEKLRVNFIQGPDYGADTAKYAGEAKESAERAYSYQLIALRSEETAQAAAISASQDATSAHTDALSAREDAAGVASAAQAAVNSANQAAEYADTTRGYVNQAISSANSAAISAANAAASAESAETANQQAKEMAKITMDKVAESAVGYPSQQGTLEYNGQVQTPTWDIFYEPQKMTVTGETSGTNAGTYTITMTPKPTYYWWDNGTTTARTQTWKIDRAKITSVPSQSGTILYDGTPKSPTWNNYDPNKLTIGGTTTATSAGIYTATFTPKSNYQWADGTITAKDVTWEIASQSLEVPSVVGGMQYNGSVQSPSISPYDTGAISASGELSGTNAGTYTITFSLITPNSQWKDGTKGDKLVTWRILPKSITVPTVTNTNKTYNGSAQSPTIGSYSASEITVSGTLSATNAGDYTIRFNLTSTSNYIWSDMTTAEKTAAWKIAKAAGRLEVYPTEVLIQKTTPKTMWVTKTGDGTISIHNNNPEIVTVTTDAYNNMTITGVSDGTATITVSLSEGDNYTAAPSVNCTAYCTFYDTVSIVIDPLNSNPASPRYSSRTFTAEPGSDAWREFFGYYPVMLKDGVEGKRLDPNDFTKHEDGTAADITSGAEGDVMIAFPRCGLKIERLSDGRKQITMTNNPNASGFSYNAFKRGNTLKDKFYLGAYEGTFLGGKVLCSLSGKNPDNGFGGSMTSLRQKAQAKGSGYDLSAWYQLIYRQCMYILEYANLDSQTSVGMGLVNRGSMVQYTGLRTNTKGMNWGESTGEEPVKLFGIENFWGNMWEWVDGICYKEDSSVWTATENFNDTGENYTKVSDYYTPSAYGYYMNQSEVGSDLGFLPVALDGSSTTYFCDQANANIGAPVFGGSSSSGVSAGAFNIQFKSPTSTAIWHIARLMYL